MSPTRQQNAGSSPTRCELGMSELWDKLTKEPRPLTAPGPSLDGFGATCNIHIITYSRCRRVLLTTTYLLCRPAKRSAGEGCDDAGDCEKWQRA